MVPEPVHPPHRDFEVTVEYDFADGQPRPIQVPSSNEEIMVLELSTQPKEVNERFVGGHRLLTAPNGTRRLRLHCRYRIFGIDDAPPAGDPRAPESLFPGADRLAQGKDAVVEVP